MQHTEKLTTNQFNDEILFWSHHFYDIFVLADAYYMKDILEYVNSTCPTLQFAIENAINNSISFLGIMIKQIIQFILLDHCL